MNGEETIFEQALGIGSPQAREEFLRHACAEDTAMFERLQGLLRAHDRAGKFADPIRPDWVPPLGGESSTTAAIALTEKPADRIGRYKLLEQIGEGGFGVVWMAEQEEPVRRRVALKIIKLGMDTRSVVARFEAERQALALMDHPNIARVFDGGATESGRPYFVMELVRGLPITKYCDETKMSTRERLDLFGQVCRAVQHAHQKGIIHRDLKPSNILVTEQDGRPVPKVIDFGVAKATEGRLTDKTLFTGFQQLIGTPTYMSPEQAGMGGLDVDTRSDTYSLGVVLYELLTGRPPFDTQTLLKEGYEAVLRTIREVDPPKPSTRVSTLQQADLLTAAQRRQTDPPKLLHLLQGDLDWIVMKCLEKDRARRYETANALALDLERYLDNEPVLARPPSTLYGFQKLVRRNKVVFAAIGAVATALVIGLAVSTVLFIRERQAYKRAVAAENTQSQLRQQAEAGEKKASAEASKSRQVAQFLKDMLSGVGPSVALGRDTTLLREILDKTADRLSKDLQDQPDVEAELRNTIGEVYLALDRYEEAEAMHRDALALRRKALGDGHADTIQSLNLLADVLHKHRHNSREAQILLRKGLGTRRKLLGNQHPETVKSMHLLADVLRSERNLAEAEALYREALGIERRLLRNEHPNVTISLTKLALVLRTQGKLVEAEAMLEEGLALDRKLQGNDYPHLAFSRQILADVLREQGKLAEAETLYRELLPMKRKLLGDKHPNLAGSLHNLADLLRTQGRLAEAETFYREAVGMWRKLVGSEHPATATSLVQLADVLSREGKLGEAEAILRETVAMAKTVFGSDHRGTRNLLIEILREQGKLPEMEALFRDLEALFRDELTNAQYTHSKNPANLAVPLDSLLEILLSQGKHAEAEQVIREVVTPSIENQPGSTGLLRVRGIMHAQRGRLTEAAADFGRIIESDPDYDHEVWLWLATVLVKDGKLDTYREHCRKSLKRFGMTTHPLTANWIANACLILPPSKSDLETVAKLVDVSLSAGTYDGAITWFQFAKGWAEYRQGHFGSAVEWTQKVVARAGRSLDRDVEAYMVLAMAQHKLKQVNDARASLAKGLAIDLGESGELVQGGMDWIIAHLLIREAKALIEGQPSADRD